MKFLLVSALCFGTVFGNILRNPGPEDILPFLKAIPLHPTRIVPLFPSLISNARVDYGVGLPGGRGKPKENCSENRTLSVWDYGVITSPKYPEDYPPSLLCEWVLSSPEGTKIYATVFDIDTQSWFLNYFDAVSFSKDGQFHMVDNYAGDQNEKTPFVVQSSGNRFGIRFKSNTVLNYRGFKLAYIVRPDEGTGEDYESNDDGICGRATFDPTVTTTTTAPVEPETTTAAAETTTAAAETTTAAEESTTAAAETTAAAAETTAVPEETTAATAENGTRIIGNNPATPHQFPWMVAMLIDEKAFCGGSVIDEQHILTAAHCTHGAEKITILIGAHDLKMKEEGRLIVNVTKENIFTHPMYNMDNVFYDVSIIRLPEKLTFSDKIRPVCLPNRKYVAETFYEREVTVTGWGITADKGKISPVLQQTNVSVLSNAACRQVFRDILTGNNMCAKTTPTMSPCRGDSGGPLMIRETDHYTVLGVVSFGTFTCERGYPVAFTRVTAFLDYVTLITGRKL